MLVPVAATILAGGPAAAAPADGDEAFGITVRGQGEIRVAPDEAVLTVGVETFAVELAAAKADNDRRSAAVLAAAKKLGVPEKRIATDWMSVLPRYERGSAAAIEGYTVRRTMAITLDDLSQFEELLTAVPEAGANRVQSADFRTKELRAHRDEARALALRAAREKAEAMAAELGRSVGSVRAIIEEAGAPQPVWGRASPNAWQEVAPVGPGLDGPTAPGQVAVTASVTVIFDLAERQ